LYRYKPSWRWRAFHGGFLTKSNKRLDAIVKKRWFLEMRRVENPI
jgi:hypothetical protein